MFTRTHIMSSRATVRPGKAGPGGGYRPAFRLRVQRKTWSLKNTENVASGIPQTCYCHDNVRQVSVRFNLTWKKRCPPPFFPSSCTHSMGTPETRIIRPKGVIIHKKDFQHQKSRFSPAKNYEYINCSLVV